MDVYVFNRTDEPLSSRTLHPHYAKALVIPPKETVSVSRKLACSCGRLRLWREVGDVTVYTYKDHR